MKLVTIALTVLTMLAACSKKASPTETAVGNNESAFSVNPNFSGRASVMETARKVFPESSHITLQDFWTSSDSTHEFVVFFAGREIKGGFESMYWRYLTFVKKKTDHDWSVARVFDMPDNHPGPFGGTSAWLEQNAKEIKAPSQAATANSPKQP